VRQDWIGAASVFLSLEVVEQTLNQSVEPVPLCLRSKRTKEVLLGLLPKQGLEIRQQSFAPFSHRSFSPMPKTCASLDRSTVCHYGDGEHPITPD
jgi:hypothetical protein